MQPAKMNNAASNPWTIHSHVLVLIVISPSAGWSNGGSGFRQPRKLRMGCRTGPASFDYQVEGDADVRFMMIVKADNRTEAGEMPSERDLETMGKYNQELIDAGVMVDAAGLQPTLKGARVGLKNGKVVVIDGPFAETKELIGGYWIINVKSKAEAIEWAKKIPFNQLPNAGREPEVEVRQYFEIEDFPNASAEVVEQERKHFGRK
jgi:hypothetical protein